MRHIGFNNKTASKLIIVRMSIPNAEDYALVIESETLPNILNDAVMYAVESNNAQSLTNLQDYLGRQVISNGENMIMALHNRGLLKKVKTSDITMTAGPGMSIALDELNTRLKTTSDKGNSITPQVAPPSTFTPMESTIDNLPLAVANARTEQSFYDAPIPPKVVTPGEALVTAKNLLMQAEMAKQDVLRYENEAYSICPSLKPTQDTPTVVKDSEPVNTKKKPGRPKSKHTC